LKLAIADASDQALESGVFLKAGSLNSIGVDLNSESTEGGNDPLDPHCIRGCKPGKFKFTRPQPFPTPLTIHYLIAGTANYGTDYQQIPDSVVIPANQDSVILNINPLTVLTPTGPRTVTLKVLSPYNCGNGQANIIDSSTITIFDSLYVKIISPPVTVCPNTEVTIEAQVDATLNYEWSPAALIPDPLPLGLIIHPKPTVPTTYTITATMPGAPATCPPSRARYLANVEAIPQIIVPAKDTTLCIQDSVDLNVYALPENIGYTFNWSPATYLRDDHSTNNKFFAPPGDYTYTLTATSPIAHCSSTNDMTIHIIPPFTFNSVSPIDTTINYGDQVQLNSESEAIYWIWDPGTFLNDPTIKSPIASPTRSIEYTLIGINEYGCRDSALVRINVAYESISNMPNAFSPNGDGLNDVFKIENYKYEKLLSFKIFNRYGQIVYDGSDGTAGWNGMINDKPAPADVYFYQVQMVLPGAVQKNLKGDVTLIR
jgi:gliding motility-associated-like protein